MTAISMVAHAGSQALSLAMNRRNAVTQRFTARLAPYISILLVFVAFVIWNGGVILGQSDPVYVLALQAWTFVTQSLLG